ncbi:polysaccharide pyruvyl transferase CsaB [Lysinibacillus alkalisoli]|uniref:Polysaccharide pyruvyl transferase CsaB n=1 Tax=Lysinibacillus alkalisoli TaxID=1911548 RepID=A0A917D5W4_9BACI|nr:polysaccharide pyruvyl transferase family protein [Lysinibacillus alkalisoli]GGG13074.1 polysaccharide pyruvyl transferase CsaB [Lysinibacillus alkalisoli]
MKIGIVGNYGNDNNGDEAILYSILKQVKETFPVEDKDITVFSNNTQQTSERYGVTSYPLYYRKGNLYKTFIHTYKNNKRYVAQFDLLIIGGGGILMDFYRREAHLYGTYAMMAKQMKVPYIIYGCGAGPLDTITGKLFIRVMCSYAENVSVRDPESKELLERIGVKKDVAVIGDPAFTLKQEKTTYAKKPKKIGVSAVPYYNANYWPEGNIQKYDEYITSMANNLDALLEAQDVEITFFATKYPQDVTVTKDIQKKMRYHNRVQILDENLYPDRLLEVVAEQDIVIGTRLHSLILATDAETPVLAISYHVKVQDFMSLVNASDRCLSMEDIARDPKIVAKSIQKMNENWDELIIETKQIANHIHSEAMKGKELMKRAVKEL